MLGILPEHIQVASESIDGSIIAAIDVFEPIGAEAYLYLNTPAAHAFIAHVEADHAFTVGGSVRLSFDPQYIVLLDQETEQVV